MLCIGNAFCQDLITTVGGTLTVEHENDVNPNEDSPKVIDGDVNTKFLLFNFTSVWIQYEFTTATVADRYALTSANDAAGRDPRDWTFEGSNDGSSWTTLDTQTGITFASRFQTQVFTFENTDAYKFYRINITANNGDGLFQLAEWRMYKTQAPVAPSALVATATAGNEIYLEWTDNSNAPESSEDGFVLERSEDGTNFEEIATVAANTTRFTDSELQVNTAYTYQIKAVNLFESGYSNTASATTLNYPGYYTDITDDGGVLTPSVESTNPDEVSAKIIDNDASTKVFLGSVTFPVSFEYESTSNIEWLITKYTITSANDFPVRDPQDWTLEASVDGSVWDVLDTRTGETFSDRFEKRTFLVSAASATAYTHFRLNVSANGGSSNFQFAEWEVWGIPTEAPAIPTNLDVVDSTHHSISLAWTDNANNETEYVIERSTDGTVFQVVDSAGANETTYTDEALDTYTVYYYRIKAINGGSPSMYSAVVQTRTNVNPFFPFPPENVAATATSDNSISLTWDDVSTVETGFQIQRSLDGVEFEVIDSVEADVETYEDQELMKGTSYYYRLIAYNDLGQSEFPSNVATATTTGANIAPSFNNIDDVVACNTETLYEIKVTGITAGEDEANQTYRFTISSDTPDLFETLTIAQTTADTTVIAIKTATDAIASAMVTVTITDDGSTNNGGIDTYSQSFEVITDKTEISITSDTPNPVKRGATITLTANGGTSYTWLDGPGILSNLDNSTITVKPTQDYPYMVDVITPLGCQFTHKIAVKMAGDYNLDPNNILTPDNDGFNDVWVVWNINAFPENEVKIYDTSGRIVFSQKAYNNTWDGRSNGSQLPAGVYYYIITFGSGIPAISGSLTIVH